MTYENRKTHRLYEVTVTRGGRVYLKGHDGEKRSVKDENLIKSYKQVRRPEPKVGRDWTERPSSVSDTFARTSRPDNPDVGVHWHPQRRPPEPVGPLHEPTIRHWYEDKFTVYGGGAGVLAIVLIIAYVLAFQ